MYACVDALSLSRSRSRPLRVHAFMRAWLLAPCGVHACSSTSKPHTLNPEPYGHRPTSATSASIEWDELYDSEIGQAHALDLAHAHDCSADRRLAAAQHQSTTQHLSEAEHQGGHCSGDEQGIADQFEQLVVHGALEVVCVGGEGVGWMVAWVGWFPLPRVEYSFQGLRSEGRGGYCARTLSGGWCMKHWMMSVSVLILVATHAREGGWAACTKRQAGWRGMLAACLFALGLLLRDAFSRGS
jgi:hypothetical protein